MLRIMDVGHTRSKRRPEVGMGRRKGSGFVIIGISLTILEPSAETCVSHVTILVLSTYWNTSRLGER
jgi:hypothetical protein